MGLDMYLTKRTYLGANYEHNNVKGSLEVTRGKDNKPVPIQLKRITYINENVGYWRKANHIHEWFVQNVQDGQDDCDSYYVSQEQLTKLRDDCKSVLANRELAEETLPTQSGFFFGGTDYDEYYFRDCEDTVALIDAVLSEDNTFADFEYTSNW